MQPIKVDSGKGVAWYGSGWHIFMINPVMWLLMAAIFLVLAAVLMFIPLVGPLIFWLISPALIAGLMYAAEEAQADRPIEIGYLFKGLTDETRRKPLLMLGALALVAGIVIALIVGLIMGGSIGMFMMGMEGDAGGVGIVVAVLLVCILWFVVFMAMAFAIPLVMFDNSPPVDAVKESFHASTANILPLLIFAVIYFVLAMIASIPFALGFLVLIPVAVAALYAGYRDVYPAANAGAPPEDDVMIVE